MMILHFPPSTLQFLAYLQLSLTTSHLYSIGQNTLAYGSLLSLNHFSDALLSLHAQNLNESGAFE